MRPWPLLPTLLAALASAAPSLDVTLDARGVAAVTLDGVPFLTDLGVQLTAPGWNGQRGSQRDLTAADVQRELVEGALTLRATLVAGEQRTQFRLTRRGVPGGVRLEYELVPEQAVAVENVLLMGGVPAAGHAGTTRYTVVGDEPQNGTLPEKLNADAYRFCYAGSFDWAALVDSAGRALRLQPEGLSVALQDDRKFNVPVFGLHLPAGGGARTLPAGEPIRFALELTAATREEVDAAAKAAQPVPLEVPLTSHEPLKAGPVSADRATVAVYEPVVLTPAIAATFDNPFDPADIDVAAEVTGPDGKAVTVPGFYTAPFERALKGGRERWTRAGEPGWRVRVTPTQPGDYRAVVRVRDRSGAAECPVVTFRATPGDLPGFVRVSRDSPGYFQLDGGQSYFPVGENMCWPGGRGGYDYDAWLPPLGKAGGNWIRIWMSSWNCALEWTSIDPLIDYHGAGRYSLAHGAKLDHILEVCRQHGIRAMLCLGTYGEMTEGGYFNEGQWKLNPYRYLIARYSADPTVFAWEFWNEAQAPAPWVAEMAAYLKANDPCHHLVSTSYGDEAVWKLPDVDFAMTHHYGDSGNTPDFTDQFVGTTHAHRAFGKPHFVAEFGIDWKADDGKYDPDGQGQGLHNGMWAGVMAGGGGTPMLWYWDGYVHPKDLYHVFTPLAKLIVSVDWARTRLAPLAGVTLQRGGNEPATYRDMELSPGYGWGGQGRDTYSPGQDGRVQGGPVASTIGSPTRGNPGELHTSLTFHLDMPADGQFVVGLGTVSGHARLRLALDGAVKVDEPLDAGEMGKGPWKASRYLEQWKVWQSDYDKDYAVPVPAGKHTVVIDCPEGDWLSLRFYRITGYQSSRYPDLHAVGLVSERLALLWLHDKASTWRAVQQKLPPQTQRDLQVTLPGLADGAWRVEWWNTYTGEVTATQTVAPAGGKLVLEPPPFERDVAARLAR
ncbi:MAG: DUF5060 domain-containing protein [Armatimonadetes bacterium]|nr:DUF5060 domain-containing protein [Armatimonadota bacterium]